MPTRDTWFVLLFMFYRPVYILVTHRNCAAVDVDVEYANEAQREIKGPFTSVLHTFFDPDNAYIFDIFKERIWS